MAAQSGNEDVCRLLLASGADASIKNKADARPSDLAKAFPRIQAMLEKQVLDHGVPESKSFF